MKELNPPVRTLMGPGPSGVHPLVLKAMATPVIGHLDPGFIEIMNGTMELLREVFGTKNELTMPMSGTGSAGMETLMVNLLEPGDKIVIGVHGLFGQRMVDVASRAGAEVIPVEAAWGTPLDPAAIEAALSRHKGVKAVAVVHAETSTGVRQPLKEIADIAHRFGALFLVDCVTSLGGIPVEIDKNEVDAAYSGTQKCLSVPPGLSPVTFNEKARRAFASRKTKVQSWYLDLNMIQNYWGAERFYHHTAPVSMIYALHEGLRLIVEEGLENVFARHAINGRALWAGLEAMGLKLVVDEAYRLPELTTVYIPENIPDAEVRRRLLEQYGLEIGGGLGEFKGKVWRIGLMGYTCQKKNVMLCLGALEDVLAQLGFKVEKGAGLAAATRVWDEAGSG
ncbi:MAG: alanine-glyoxylate transaminase / serine-glyoxylate transaminase / serine-pyruvate transaminase [Clostridia bacterium]|nr:alanine-glyoxylate transaminase / serine-glyoxylate transaminase / serine-pyruvate transaminase [Clostridia bacterium]